MYLLHMGVAILLLIRVEEEAFRLSPPDAATCPPGSS